MGSPSTWRSRVSGGAGSQRPFLPSLVASVAVVAIAGLIGWLLLISIKWLIVAILFALGAALIVVPILGWKRFTLPPGPGRAHRIGQLLTTIVLGAVLIALAFIVSRHGWLLIVVPVAVVALGRLASRFGEWRAARAQR